MNIPTAEYARTEWKPVIRVFVPGIPKGQPRPRAFAFRGKARVYDPGTAEGWKGAIAVAMANVPGRNLEGPIRLGIVFFFPRPKRLLRQSSPLSPIWHTAKPDLDNCVKAVQDALTVLRVWHDDSQVCDTNIQKFYTSKSIGNTGAMIEVSIADGKGATDTK